MTWYRCQYFDEEGESLLDLRRRNGFSNAEAAAFLGVTVRTFYRWLHHGGPEWAKLLLALRAGFIPWDGWQGWEMHKGYLIPPGYRSGGYCAGEILAMCYERQLHSCLRRENRQLKEALRLACLGMFTAIPQDFLPSKLPANALHRAPPPRRKWKCLLTSNHRILRT
jgi:hypothetical protein